jgi:hypothetical protein
MAGYRGAQFGIAQTPANTQQVGQALMGQQSPQDPAMAPAPGMLPSLGVPSLMDLGMHSETSTQHAVVEAARRMQASPERSAHSVRSPIAAWQLASLGIPKLELDLDALSSGQREDDA